MAHILISRFVDHLPYYRQETIDARFGVHTLRSTLARTAGNAGAALFPLFEALKRFVLSCPVLLQGSAGAIDPASVEGTARPAQVGARLRARRRIDRRGD